MTASATLFACWLFASSVYVAAPVGMLTVSALNSSSPYSAIRYSFTAVELYAPQVTFPLTEMVPEFSPAVPSSIAEVFPGSSPELPG